MSNFLSKGSVWNKWDLHIHTPASVVNGYSGNNNEVWAEFINELESLPEEIKAIGINDYFSLEGYRRVIQEKKGGRLKNIELILPVLELRISNYAGSSGLKKINFHIIFSNKLSSDIIETNFLRNFTLEYDLSDGNTWRGVISGNSSIEELGEKINNSCPDEKRSSESNLEIGFRNICFPEERIWEVLSLSVFKKKILTAVGLSEWDQMRWESGSGGIKKTIINKVDFIFTNSPSVKKFYERKQQLIDQEVNSNILDCSDSHFFHDSSQLNRLGHVYTWLKADLEFEGLRRITKCYSDRVHICEIGQFPNKVQYVRQNPSMFIERLSIKKQKESKLDEIWFNNDIELNSDMVAIIGNQGNGKSALVDILALCGNSKKGIFSFLNSDKFCDRTNKANEFIAKMQFCDGYLIEKGLDESINDSEIEKVCYVPQSFFEDITNETIITEGGIFYGEIKKVIFSHIPIAERLGFSSFDELKNFYIKEYREAISSNQERMKRLNIKIAGLEIEGSAKNIQLFNNKVEEKKRQIEAHLLLKPKVISNPGLDSEENKRIEEIRQEESDLEVEIHEKEQQKIKLNKQKALLTQKIQAIQNLNSQINKTISEIQEELKQNELSELALELEPVSIDIAKIVSNKKGIEDKITSISEDFDLDNEKGIKVKLVQLKAEREKISSKLEKELQEYQEYLSVLRNWQSKLDELENDETVQDSLKSLQTRLSYIQESIPEILEIKRGERIKLVQTIHDSIVSIAKSYKEITHSIREYIESNHLTKETYPIVFKIEIVQNYFCENLFKIIKNSTGTFLGVDEGSLKISEILKKYDFNSVEDVIKFLIEIENKIKQNYNVEPPVDIELESLLRKGKNVQDLYDAIYNLDYLDVQYSISFTGKPLKLLSPGERGILLLIFYLLLDQRKEPLIIDQPEGNLNNQAIFDYLVPVFKKAKETRQIIIVTHNPNLAVVCDAEQIIHSSIDFENGNKVKYQGGSLENPIYNKYSLNVLEGTKPAFDARTNTYDG